MSRVYKKKTIADGNLFSKKLLAWAQSFDTFTWLDSNEYSQKYSSFDKVLALGVKSDLQTGFKNAFEKLNRYQLETQDYLFGYLSYDLKNDTEQVASNNYDGVAFPDLYFFQPQKLFFIRDNSLEILYDDECADEINSDFDLILKTTIKTTKTVNKLNIKSRISEAEYYKKIKQVQTQILQGNSYELNFCMEYYATKNSINPLSVFTKLNTISSPPFAAFFKHKNQHILSASPERFARKEGQKVISQPIKGTIKRSSNQAEDDQLITQLKNDPKELSENIMIVDLVRNDLSKTATKASVQVEELCEVYTFKQVHQLISTVSSKVKKEITPVNLIKSLFPMGSMTGAPKISTMRIIEKLEESKRGVYSGALGYFTPVGDFDFNVVIRSILHNSNTNYTSFSVGGAITAKSNPNNEYEECLLKAQAMIKVLTN